MSSDQRSMFWLAVLGVGLPVTGAGWPIYHLAGLPAAHVLGWGTFIVGAMAAVAGVAGLVVLAREHELSFKWRPSIPKPRLQWPIWFGEFTRKEQTARVEKLLKQRDEMVEERTKRAEYTQSLEEKVLELTPQNWLLDVPETDKERLAESLFNLGELQHGHIGWGLDNPNQPCLVVEFEYVNASVYTVLATRVEGTINVVGETELAGGWKFQPVRLPRNRTTRLSLRWVIDNPVSVDHLKSLVKESESIWFDMHRVRVSIEAEEDSSIKSELRYPHQQIWQRRYDPPQAPAPDATEEESE